MRKSLPTVQSNTFVLFKFLHYGRYLFILLTLLQSCKKTGNSPENPCNGLMNESPPMKVGIMLYDKQRGNNLILSGGLSATDVKVTLSSSPAPLTNWRIINSPGSALNGMLELVIFHEKAGEYRYKIETKGLKDVEFAYTIKQVKSDSPCKMYYYPIDILKAINWDYVPLEIGDKIYPNTIKVLLN